MNKDNFFTNLLQNLGFIAAISIAFFQYSLNDSFKFLFKGDDQLFKSATLVALIISIAIIIGLFAYRYYFLNKIYFNNDKKNKYFNDLNSQQQINLSNPEESTKSRKQFKQPIEPWNFTLLQFAFFLIIISLISFVPLLMFNYISVLAVLFYVFFICSAVASISIFSIQLYRDSEYKTNIENINTIILGKIREICRKYKNYF